MLRLSNLSPSQILPSGLALPALALGVSLAVSGAARAQVGPNASGRNPAVGGHTKKALHAADEGEVSTFPLSMNASLGTSVGMGTFVPSAKFNPSLRNSLSLNPSFSIPVPDGMPKLSLSGGINFGIEWATSQRQSTVAYNRIVRVSDFSMTLGAGKLYKESFTGITVGGNLTGFVPISLASRAAGRWLFGVGGLSFRWSTPELGPIGKINFGYSPKMALRGYGEVATTIPCESAALALPSGLNAGTGVEQSLVSFRRVEQLPNGKCILAGRQSLATQSNGFSVSWSQGNHSLSANFAYNITFLRPLSKGLPSSENASSQDFMESTSGGFSYTYNVPIEQNLSITAGMGSGYGVQGMDGSLRLPFYDLVSFFGPFGGFVGAANNNTTAYVSVSAGI